MSETGQHICWIVGSHDIYQAGASKACEYKAFSWESQSAVHVRPVDRLVSIARFGMTMTVELNNGSSYT